MPSPAVVPAPSLKSHWETGCGPVVQAATVMSKRRCTRFRRHRSTVTSIVYVPGVDGVPLQCQADPAGVRVNQAGKVAAAQV
jgi:hypothetical protein